MQHGFLDLRPTPTANSVFAIGSLAASDARGASRWDEFVLHCPNATFFHRSGWQQVLIEVFRYRTYFLYAERAGTIEGVLPLAHLKSHLFGNRLTSLPFAVYGGVASTSPEAADALEAHAQALARTIGVDYLELRNVFPRHDDWPKEDVYFTFRKELSRDEDANMRAIPRKQRAMVRKGIAHGLTSEIDVDSSRFFALYSDNVHRHGTPALPHRYFATLQRVFGNDCEILTVIDSNRRPLSSVLSFYFRHEVLPYYAGDDISARELAANDFKYWELMRRACARGITMFDYGRSKRDTGPFSFKKNWGFKPEPLHYEFQLYRRDEIPRNNPANPKYRMFIALWRRMPLRLANALGPHIVRGLG